MKYCYVNVNAGEEEVCQGAVEPCERRGTTQGAVEPCERRGVIEPRERRGVA